MKQDEKLDVTDSFQVNPVQRVQIRECAPMVRALLKQEFPGVKFSVRMDIPRSCAGQGTINVSGAKGIGITQLAVKQVMKYFTETEKNPHADMEEIMNGNGGYRQAPRYRVEEDGSLTPLYFGCYFYVTAGDISDEDQIFNA